MKYLLLAILVNLFSQHADANPECWQLKGEVISKMPPSLALKGFQLSEEAFRACEKGIPTYLIRDRLERIFDRQRAPLPSLPVRTTCQYNGPVLVCESR